MNNQTLGKLGEKIASEYLISCGYKIVEMNFYQRWGEIDIVAKDPCSSQGQDVLVFVEVKTRMEHDRITPEESITPWKIRTLKRSSLFYKSSHPELPQLLRIDFVGICLNSELRPVRINLIKNITG